MNQRGRGLASRAKWAMFAAAALGAFGCELITSVDRSLIDGGTSTSTGTGGGGGKAECAQANDCPDPGSECVTRTCEAGKCGTVMVAAGTAVAAQTAGDCKVQQCDGMGMSVSASDDLDVPTDKNPCTDDVCTAGVPSNKPAAAGTSCGASLVCDSAGACVGCAAAADCPGTTDECGAPSCTAGVCGMTFTAAGTPTTAQTAGDCKTSQCDGLGTVVTVPANTDLPVDGNECTDDLCTAGAASNPPTMAGGVCTTAGGTVCNGSGACVACLVASTCPGSDTDCQARTCNAGVCGIAFTAAGTKTATQVVGDCKANKCDGAGNSVPSTDDTDLPDDSNPCTNDVCTAGVVSHPPASSGTVCGVLQACDGAGSCTGCVTAATCPGTDTECQTRTCTASVCGFSFTAAGTAVAAQTAGDCKKNTCNGAGAIVNGTDNSDVPVDSNACTSDVCTAGSPSNPPTASGTACAQNGGTLCNGGGTCVQCLAAATCPGNDTDCKVRTCTLGACGVANTAAGTVTSSQTAGDCKENQCDGAGNSAPVTKNVDVPVDSNQCTSDVCTAGVPSNPPTAAGTGCNQNGGLFCSGAGTCGECGIGANCASGVCTGNVCQAPTCNDGVKNGVETGLDCGGGTCPSCAVGLGCSVASDCASGVCTGNVCSLINGCDPSTAPLLAGPVTVTFANGNFTYAPACIKVTAGTTVTFNGNFSGHPLQGGQDLNGVGVPASSGPFATLTNTGTTADFVMSTTGTFPYYCTAHVGLHMAGTVFVVP